MSSEPKITMRMLAGRLGVSVMTVSRALSGRRPMDPALAARVRELARKLGYRPDPVVSGVMRSLKRTHGAHQNPTVAFVWTNKMAQAEREYRGAAVAAEKLGYTLEVMKPWLQELEPHDVTRILWSRGIRGVLLAPNDSVAHPAYRMDWDKFSAVLIGSSLTNAGLPRVQSDHFDVTRVAVRRMRFHGYRKIGLVLDENYNERVGRAFLGAFRAYSGNDDAMAVIYLNFHMPWEEQCRAMAVWLETTRPDAVLADVPQRFECMRRCGVKMPDDIGFATLTALVEFPDIAGVAHNMERVGAEAMHHLDRMLCNNETGRSKNPVKLLVKGHWVTGNTLRSNRRGP